MHSPEALCQKITDAFQGMTYPGDENVVYSSTRENPWRADVLAGFRGKLWQSITREQVREYCDDLPIMTPVAFRYFLPAYMLHCVRTPLEVNTACTSVVYLLTPPDQDQVYADTWWKEREGVFDAAQCEAIVAFLEHEDDRERKDWAKMGKHLTTTDVTRALNWWRERVAGVAR